MKLITSLENLKFYAYHGLYDYEQRQGADFYVHIFISEEIDENKNLARIEELINYEDLFEIARAEMEHRRDFIEDVAKSILQRISHFLLEREVSITVKITKPNPGGKFGSGEANVSLSI